MKNLSFWAQSLDNQSPDLIFKDGIELTDDESRQNIVSEIYEVPKSNIDVLPTNSSITARYSYPKFVIEAIPAEKDQVNRLAPIVIYGVIPSDWSDLWVKDVCDEIDNFVSSKLNRTLDNNSLTAIQNWLDETLKKKGDGFQNNLLKLVKNFLVQLMNGLKLLANKILKN